MHSDLERTLVRELDEVAGDLVVPDMPLLPTAGRRPRTAFAVPVLAAAAVVAIVVAGVLALLQSIDPGRREPVPAPSPTPSRDDSVSRALPADPFVVSQDLYVGGEQVPGQWANVRGRGTHWVGLRVDGTWWWGYDAEPQEMERAVGQPPAVSPSAGYTARILNEGGGAMLVGADTEFAGEGFGGVDLPGASLDPPPSAVAVTDDGLVVAGGADFQRLWRPLVDGELVDLSQTAPGR